MDGDNNSYYPYCDAPFNAAELWVLERADIATAVEEVKAESGKVKTIYDLNGRKVENPTKGLYIIDGKKVLIK